MINLNEIRPKELATRMVKEIVEDCSSDTFTVNQLRKAVNIQLGLWVENNQLSDERAKIVAGYAVELIENATT